jgi:hypothetical protein
MSEDARRRPTQRIRTRRAGTDAVRAALLDRIQELVAAHPDRRALVPPDADTLPEEDLRELVVTLQG